MTTSEIVWLSAGVMLGGVYADIDGPFWGVWIIVAIVAFVISVTVSFWRRRFGS